MGAWYGSRISYDKYDPEHEDAADVRILSIYQKLEGSVIRLNKTVNLDTKPRRVRSLKEYLQRLTSQIIINEPHMETIPILLVMSVDGVPRVWRFGDRAVHSRFRELTEVTDRLPSGIRAALLSAQKILELTMQKAILMHEYVASLVNNKIPDEVWREP